MRKHQNICLKTSEKAKTEKRKRKDGRGGSAGGEVTRRKGTQERKRRMLVLMRNRITGSFGIPSVRISEHLKALQPKCRIALLISAPFCPKDFAAFHCQIHFPEAQL